MRYMRLKRLTSTQVTNGLGLSGAEHVTSDPRYIRITDIASDGSLRRDIFASQPRSVVEDKWVVANDILIASVGATVGKSYFHNQPGEYCFAGYLSRIRINPTLADPKFIYHWTQSRAFWDQVNSQRVSSTIENLSAGRIAQFMAPQPPLTKQKEIADYLDHETAEIDATIVEQSALMGLVHERQSASIDLVYQEAAQQATQSRPIKYSFRINPTVNQATRQVPQNSVYLPMSAISEFGKIDTSRSRPTADMMGGYTYIENGDVVVAKVTPCFENGKGAVIAGLPDGLGFATTEVTNFRSMGPALPEYLAVVFRTSRFRLGGEAEMTGAGGLRRVPDRYMNNFKIAELNTQEQRRLIDRVGEIDRVSHGLAHDLNKAIDFARERRSALITAAVTGQIDVTARHKPAAEQLEDDIAQGLHREN